MFRITLRAVRISCGYTLEEAAAYCQVPVKEYESYEKDFGATPASSVYKLRRLFGFPLDFIAI